MYSRLFREFLASSDTLQVYRRTTLLFASEKDKLLPLLEYVTKFGASHRRVVIFDKIMGNAAALLAIKAHSEEVYSPLGSQLAASTLEKYGIKYQFTQVVPYIQKPPSAEMCPMEKLSMDKDPDEFYNIIRTSPNPSP